MFAFTSPAPVAAQCLARSIGSPLRTLSKSHKTLRVDRPRRVSTRARWVCETKSHPWGNGGLDNVANFEGYDSEQAQRDLARVKKEFEERIAEVDAQQESMWAIIFNTDIIQWDNNLLNAAMEFGLNVQLENAKVICVTERVARTMFEGHIDEMYVLRRSDTSSGGDQPEFLSGVAGDTHDLLIAFQTADDASRFAANLEAEDRGLVAAEALSMNQIRAICIQRGLTIGFVAPSFVQPSHFQDGPILTDPYSP